MHRSRGCTEDRSRSPAQDSNEGASNKLEEPQGTAEVSNGIDNFPVALHPLNDCQPLDTAFAKLNLHARPNI